MTIFEVHATNGKHKAIQQTDGGGAKYQMPGPHILGRCTKCPTKRADPTLSDANRTRRVMTPEDGSLSWHFEGKPEDERMRLQRITIDDPGREDFR